MAPEAPTGAWLFRHRSALPVPLALVLVLVRRWEADGSWMFLAGPALVVMGEGLRLWAVRHIGTISRTRTTRYGPLITAGPYAVVRNPLYVGNWFLWTGFVVWSALLWMLPVAWLVFTFQYRAIAQWEAAFMRDIYGPVYDGYAQKVSAWIPRWPAREESAHAAVHPWREVLFSERGTLLATGLMAVLLTAKRMIG